MSRWCQSVSKRVKYIVGCPAWERAWSLPLWFESVKANVPPEDTGLLFVVPPPDQMTRDAINRLSGDFAWCDVMRDKHAQFDRDKRGTADHHRTLALARNQIMAKVNQIGPEVFISWDSDLLIQPGLVETWEIEEEPVPLMTVWTWLNRQKPQTMLHGDPDEEGVRRVQFQEPMQATAMAWCGNKRAAHLDGSEWDMRAAGLWRCDVALGFQMMRPEVYTTTHYVDHPDGEDIPFNWQLERRGIPRYCYGEMPGVHLYTRVNEELSLGYPEIMSLADEKPLAAQKTGPRSQLGELLGFYPVQEGAT